MCLDSIFIETKQIQLIAAFVKISEEIMGLYYMKLTKFQGAQTPVINAICKVGQTQK